MKIVVQVIIEPGDGPAVVTEVAHLEREALTDETLGLTLAEGKAILVGVQQAVVAQQAAGYNAAQQACPACRAPRRRKGYHQLVVRSLFGTLRLDSPRLATCPCQPSGLPRSSSPLAERLPERTTPERRYLEAKWAALLPFGVTVDVLEEVLKAQGLQMNQAITFLSDGGDNVRDLQLYLILTRVLVEKMTVGENKIVEGGPSTPPHREMPHVNATWYKPAGRAPARLVSHHHAHHRAATTAQGADRGRS